jgi:hypothetical protein
MLLMFFLGALSFYFGIGLVFTALMYWKGVRHGWPVHIDYVLIVEATVVMVFLWPGLFYSMMEEI